MGSLGVRVDLRPGFVGHAEAWRLQLGQRVLHLRLALGSSGTQGTQLSARRVRYNVSTSKSFKLTPEQKLIIIIKKTWFSLNVFTQLILSVPGSPLENSLKEDFASPRLTLPPLHQQLYSLRFRTIPLLASAATHTHTKPTGHSTSQPHG